MKWLAQVRHVAAKDARHTRWSLIVYVALIGVTTAAIVSGGALGPYSTSQTTMVIGMSDTVVAMLPIATVILGLVTAVALLQSDSPTRPNSFWASRPLAPSAVFGAKLSVVALAVIGVPIVLGSVALASFQTDRSDTVALLAHTAVAYGELALAVMVIGALTEDLRGAIVAFIVMFFGTFFLIGALQDVSANLPPVTSRSVSAIAIAAGLCVVAYLYRTRDRRRRTWTVGIAAGAFLVIASMATPSAVSVQHLASGGPSLQIEPMNANMWGRNRQVSVRVRAAGASGADAFAFEPDSVRFRVANGKDVRIAAQAFAVDLTRTLPMSRALHWIDGGPRESPPISVETQEGARSLIAQGIDSVEVTGTVSALRGRVIATLPLKDGAMATSDGRRIAIYGVSHDVSGTDLWVRVSEVPRVPQESFRIASRLELQFALVNDERSEAMLVATQNGSAGMGWAVLPWIGISTSYKHLSTGASAIPNEVLPRDDAWYAGAHLVVIDWSVERRYHAHAAVAVR